jgi:hypothetical protein
MRERLSDDLSFRSAFGRVLLATWLPCPDQSQKPRRLLQKPIRDLHEPVFAAFRPIGGERAVWRDQGRVRMLIQSAEDCSDKAMSSVGKDLMDQFGS